ncbi:MAG: D-alanine--poly(phosphoribitol) ligase subunit DltC [Clostridium sp.]|nr:D-alanine--poly(phosphoribitol) ligase subunit DltC [Clostridium sp.]
MLDKVLNILEEVTGTDEIREDLDLDLFEAGLLDSLGIIEVLLKLEEVFSIKLQPTDLERKDMATVNNLISFLEGYILINN